MAIEDQESKGPSRRGILKAGALGAAAIAAAACSIGGNGGNAGAAGPAVGSRPSDSRLTQILNRKKLIAAVELGVEPAAFRDSSGKFQGWYVDVVQHMADGLGVPLEINDMNFSGIIPAIIAGKVDVGSSGITNTPTRALSIFFSNPYNPSLNVLMTLKDKKKASYNDYNQPNVTISAKPGTTQAQTEAFFFPKAKADLLPDTNAVGLEVASGRADAAVLDAGEVLALQKGNSNLDFYDIKNPLGFEFGAFGVQYGDWYWINWIDEWMRYWAARNWFQQTFDKWYSSFYGPDLLGQFQIPRY